MNETCDATVPVYQIPVLHRFISHLNDPKAQETFVQHDNLVLIRTIIKHMPTIKQLHSTYKTREGTRSQ